MRLGGPVFGSAGTPDEWIAAVRAAGYGAAYCPLGPEADDDTTRVGRLRLGILKATTGVPNAPSMFVEPVTL